MGEFSIVQSRKTFPNGKKKAEIKPKLTEAKGRRSEENNAVKKEHGFEIIETACGCSIYQRDFMNHVEKCDCGCNLEIYIDG